MNILYVSAKKNWGGVASWMVRTAESLEERGHTVHIVSAKNSLFTKRAPKSLRIHPWSFGFDYNPATILYLVYMIKKHKIDLMVTNIEKEIAVGGIAAKLCGIPNIRRVGRHDDFNDKKSKIRFRHETFVTDSIAPCAAIWEEAKEHSPWLENYPFTVIYNGRDPQYFTEEERQKIRAGWGIDDDTVVIGTTTRLADEKRVDLILDAYAKARDEFTAPAFLVISGTGKNLAALQQQADDLGISDTLLFAGFTETPLLSASGYDITLAVADNEGFPNTVVEYMSVGRPVISTDVGGVKEIIQEPLNGLLIQPGDREGLSEKMIMLVNDTELRSSMAENAKKTVAERFSQQEMIDRLEAFFHKKLEKVQ